MIYEFKMRLYDIRYEYYLDLWKMCLRKAHGSDGSKWLEKGIEYSQKCSEILHNKAEYMVKNKVRAK